MMLVAVTTELMKLRRSLVLLVTLAAPLCVTAFAAVALATRSEAVRWERFLDEGLAMWSFFMLPMSVTAITALLAQLEHGSRMWHHLLVLPPRRATFLSAKVIVAVLLLLAMQLFVYIGLYLAGFLVGAAMPGHSLVGDRQFGEMATGMLRMAIGAFPMVVVQLWAALRWRSFVVPLVIGILGTFFALVITASNVQLYIPWLLQIYALLWPNPAGVIGLYAGIVGGFMTLAAMLLDLAKREFRVG